MRLKDTVPTEVSAYQHNSLTVINSVKRDPEKGKGRGGFRNAVPTLQDRGQLRELSSVED